MRIHVDLVDRGCDEAFQRVGDSGVVAGHREDRPVVTCVTRPVEERDLGYGCDGVGEAVDDVDPATLGDVGHGLDEHALMLPARDGWDRAVRRPRASARGRRARGRPR